ncbi:small ribosomal subunit protein mS37 [Paroedura picta]|uniref:small ribosomal subunit protein mS37 n=1 Tax=Paroedura picta TaxID=143630 RepID=UPI004056DED7
MASGVPAWVARVAQTPKRGGKPPPLRPHRPLVLADHISSRHRTPGEATCVTEMSLMMACWKQNEFNDATCSKEIQAFLDCTSKADAEHKAKLHQESLDQSKTLGAKQINKLLNQFPNITHYY